MALLPFATIRALPTEWCAVNPLTEYIRTNWNVFINKANYRQQVRRVEPRTELPPLDSWIAFGMNELGGECTLPYRAYRPMTTVAGVCWWTDRVGNKFVRCTAYRTAAPQVHDQTFRRRAFVGLDSYSSNDCFTAVFPDLCVPRTDKTYYPRGRRKIDPMVVALLTAIQEDPLDPSSRAALHDFLDETPENTYKNQSTLVWHAHQSFVAVSKLNAHLKQIAEDGTTGETHVAATKYNLVSPF